MPVAHDSLTRTPRHPQAVSPEEGSFVSESLLPTRRSSIRGRNLDGLDVVLSWSIAKKLYRCPGCKSSIEVGADHVLVRYGDDDEEGHHQHWHGPCVQAIRRELEGLHSVPSAWTDAKPTRGQRRGAALKRRRRT